MSDQRITQSCWWLLLTFSMSSYLLVGALVFMVIEKPREERDRERLLELKQLIMHEGRCDNGTLLEEFLVTAIRAYRQGANVFSNETGVHFYNSAWDYLESIFFSATVVLTVGYGHVTPGTDGGKTFFIFYSLLGVPFAIFFLGNLAGRLQVLNSKLHNRLIRSLHPRTSMKGVLYMHISVVVLIIATLLFIVPAILLMWVESRWGFLDSVYFCVTSLLTIGLGDYVPGSDLRSRGSRGVYLLVTIVYLFVGTASLLMLWNIAAEAAGLSTIERGCGCLPACCRHDGTDEEREHVLSGEEPPSDVNGVTNKGTLSESSSVN